MIPEKTLWMGNINKDIDENFIRNVFKDISKKNKFINKIIDNKINSIKFYLKQDIQKGSAFIEFDSTETAEKVINCYNNKVINNFFVTLNWTKSSHQKTCKTNASKYEKSSYYTVKLISINFLFIYYQAYIGNLDINVNETELIEFFQNFYPSVFSCKIIYDLHNGVSKGYGFVYLTDNDEYIKLVKNEKSIIFHGKKLYIK